MGREIRMVPPNWEHPKDENGNFLPMFDMDYATARDEWIAGLMEHKRDEHDGLDWWEWEGNPPDRSYYRPWKDEDATWYQLWETVSEGTPVSPPFATKKQLVRHLAKYGDFWDKSGWGVERAMAFVNAGSAPSFMIANGQLLSSKDIPLANVQDKERKK